MRDTSVRRCVLVAGLVVAGGTFVQAADDNKACALLTPAEIESTIAVKVPGFQGGGLGAAQICSASSGATTVLLRLATRTGPAGREAQGIEMAKKMGIQVEVKTFGPITCSATSPPANLAETVGYNTTCSVLKGDREAAVEVTAKAQKDAVTIDKLRTLAEKMAQRF
jgi:hypothetical protein